ncbi:MAG: hypothetical protein P1U41_00470 [Vicingaceae bacterium]|nr:hypothetical protein [Vicingaceae bacterium]
MTKSHNFHIPVMGVSFTVDTPVKIAHLGVSSVMSIGDDLLAERLRKYYSEQLGIEYIEIGRKAEDCRAKRITAYLDLVYDMVQSKFQGIKELPIEEGNDLSKYFNLLPDASDLKQQFNKLKPGDFLPQDLKNDMIPGELEVNIMTKLDRQHYDKEGNELPHIHNDAHSGLRGYANSKLNSGLVLSAGLNPRLYSYISHFDNFFPDENGFLDKQIILKVSDYRSALVQGKFLAKKGIWVSEYRIESGLNCGGHAFATDGILAGPILEDFKNNRQELIDNVHEVLGGALEGLDKPVPSEPLPLKVTYQGGVGTSEEHQFLVNHYNVDSVGWATPFLLVPEAVNVDEETQQLLQNAEEKDLYLSATSPIGVPFNTLRGNSKDVLKEKATQEGKPGSTCPRQYLKLFNTEFTEQPICLSSKQYQKLKIEELDKKNLPDLEYQKAYNKITEKTCLCTGLVITAYKAYDIVTRPDGKGVAVCPGPNMAYFSKVSTLQQMVDHIYGRTNLLNDIYRPHVFVKELGMYIDYFQKELGEISEEINGKALKRLNNFKSNLLGGIEYYQELFNEAIVNSENALNEIKAYHKEVLNIQLPELKKA